MWSGWSKIGSFNLVVKEFLQPRINKNIKQFLGFAKYYRRFLKTAKPLTNLLKKDDKFDWNGTQDKAFTEFFFCSV